MGAWEVMGGGLGSCRKGCGLLGVAGSWLCPHRGRFGLEIAEKPSVGEERGRAHHGLPGAAAPGTVPHSAHTRASGWVELGTRALVAALRGPHCPVMVSALTALLLGCWLAGHSGAWGGRDYPKPTIWVSPSRVVALGGSFTIRCEGLYPDMEFFLRKAGHWNPEVQTVPDGTVAEFPIPSVSQEDGGSYTCEYHPITAQNRWSYPSDPIKIIVGEPSYPKPNISLRPSGGVFLGGAVTVWCWGQRRGVRFVLNKDGRHFQPVDSDGFGAVFPISNVRREDGGNYSCSYHSRSEPFTVSYPSEPVELVVRGGSESPAALGLTSSIIVGVSAAAAGLLLLLLVAFVCFRKTRARKGAAPRPSSTSPSGMLEAPAQQDPDYSSINEGKEMQNLEPDPGTDGLTYAELDGQALQAKWGGPAPAPEPAQPSVYAAINVSRGTPQ